METKRFMLDNPFVKFESTGCKTIARTWMTRIKNWHIILLCHFIDSRKKRHKIFLCINVFLTVSREENIITFLQAKSLVNITCLNFSKIIDESFYQKTYVQNQVMGRVLAESILLLDGKCIIGYLKKRDMEFYGVDGKDLDGIVSQLRVTDGVEVAIFLYETGNHQYKVSLRSNGPVDVSAVCAYFGGGGHVKAAGCTMHGTFYDVVNNLTLHIEKQLNQNQDV